MRSSEPLKKLIYAEHYLYGPHYADAPFLRVPILLLFLQRKLSYLVIRLYFRFFSCTDSLNWPIYNSSYSEWTDHMFHVALHSQEPGVSDKMEL